jgi:hypothetical protein
MRLSLSPWSFVALFAVGSLACGSEAASDGPPTELPDAAAADASDTADGSSEAPTLTTFCARFAQSLCAAIAPCNCETTANCVPTQTTRCELSLSSLIGGVALGDIRFLPDDASACIDASAAFAATCALPTARAQPLPCATYLADPAALDAPCSAFGRGLRCANGAGFCERETGMCRALVTDGTCTSRLACANDHVCIEGRCTGVGAAGAACTSHDACDLPLVCNIDNTCSPPADRGAACADPLQCGAGLACIAGICAEALAIGDTCTDAICGPDATCVGPDTRTCQAVGQVGDTCGGGERDCVAGLFCDFQRTIATCQPLPVAGQGCPAGNCAPGFSCNYMSSTCVAAPTLGQSCLNETSRPCAEGLACGADVQTCVAAGAEGEPCVGLGNACAEGLHCNMSEATPTCRAPGPEGYACGWDHGHCQSGLYCNAATNACEPVLGEGAPCDADAACGSTGRCDYGTSPATCVPAPSAIGESCDWMCGGGLQCAPSAGQCTPGACQFLR